MHSFLLFFFFIPFHIIIIERMHIQFKLISHLCYVCVFCFPVWFLEKEESEKKTQNQQTSHRKRENKNYFDRIVYDERWHF